MNRDDPTEACDVCGEPRTHNEILSAWICVPCDVPRILELLGLKSRRSRRNPEPNQ